MGSFEKLVVLTVLFLVTLVLGVTLNSGTAEDVDPAVSGPLASARNRADEGGFLPPEGQVEPALLSAEVETPAATRQQPSPRRSQPSVRQRSGALLADSTGLRVHPLLADFRIYRVTRDDTWAALGQRFYNDRSFSGLLRQANDGLETLVPGEEILVPIRDFRGENERRDRLEPWERGGESGAQRRADASTAKSALGRVENERSSQQATQNALVPESYEVVSGDVLSVISLKVYGTSRRWEDIYAANQDQMDNPDTLSVGMVLRIPR